MFGKYCQEVLKRSRKTHTHTVIFSRISYALYLTEPFCREHSFLFTKYLPNSVLHIEIIVY